MADQALAKSSSLNWSMQPPAKGFLERIVPGEVESDLYFEHIGRYQFASLFVSGKVVLDVACGVGYGAPVLCGGGARRYLGVDLSPEAIRMASSRFRCSGDASFVVGDACRLDGIENSSLDVVVSFETIEHLEKPSEFLARLRRVLVPGGILIISTPNRAVFNPSGRLDSAPFSPFHLREWNQDEFLDTLGDFFSVDKVLGQLPYPYWKILGRKAAAHRMLGWVRPLYQAGRKFMRRNSRSAQGGRGEVPVVPIEGWHVPTYIVCICKSAP